MVTPNSTASSDTAREAAPRHVGFGAGEEQDVASVGGSTGADLDGRPVEVGVQPVAQLHRRAAGAVVDVAVVVEGQDRGRLARSAQLIHRGGGGTGRVDPAGEHHDQHRLVELGVVHLPLDAEVLVEVARIVRVGCVRPVVGAAHPSSSKRCSALAAALSTCNLKASSDAGSC